MVISAKWMSQPWPEFEPGLLIPFFFFFFTIMLPTQPLSHLPGNWVLVPALSNCRVLDWNQSNWGLNLFDNLGKKLLGKQWVTYFDMSEQMDRQTSAAKAKKSGNRRQDAVENQRVPHLGTWERTYLTSLGKWIEEEVPQRQKGVWKVGLICFLNFFHDMIILFQESGCVRNLQSCFHFIL